MHYQPKQDLLQNRIILVASAPAMALAEVTTYARYGATAGLAGTQRRETASVAQQYGDESNMFNHSGLRLDLLTCTAEECRRGRPHRRKHHPRPMASRTMPATGEIAQ